MLSVNTVWAADGKSVVAPDAKVKKLAGGMKFTEGPVWLPKEKKLVSSNLLKVCYTIMIILLR